MVAMATVSINFSMDLHIGKFSFKPPGRFNGSLPSPVYVSVVVWCLTLKDRLWYFLVSALNATQTEKMDSIHLWR